jgi:hypothetical protein
MKYFVVLAGLLFLMFCNVAAEDTIPANNEFIEYTGRIDFSNPLAPKFSYSGVSIRACFYGTSISAILDDDIGQNYYNVILDGEVLPMLNITSGKKEYLLAEGLEDALHEIELFKRTELTFGKTQFFGFVLDEGKSLAPITKERDLFLEYIGNSITCGYGNEGRNGETFGPTTENHYLTYAAITSRSFNARHMAVSRSGIGIYRNYDGPAEGNTDCMTNYYTRIFLYDENPKYSFSEQPDLICINLGTNDFSTTGGDSALYVSNYFRLIDTIQTKYNMPEIVCLLGPMMYGNTLTEVRQYLEFIADSASRKGNGNVTFFEMSAQTGSLGIGIDYHPTVAQHKKNARELIEYISSLKNWDITPLIITAKTVAENHIRLESNTNLQDPSNNFEGFSVDDGTTEYTIDSIYVDQTNNKVLNIILSDSLAPSQNIYLQYDPGTIESEDSVKMDTINNFLITNTLTITSISETSDEVVNFFPNPNQTGVLYYNSNNLNKVNYEIIDQNGVIIANGILKDPEGQIGLDRKLSKGIYFIRCYSPHNVYTQPLVLDN